MKFESMLEGLDDLVGEVEGSRVAKRAPMLPALTEEARQLPAPPLSSELCESFGPAYGAYVDRTSFDDQIRAGIEMIKSAISREAFVGVGDDGRVMRTIDHSKDGGPWSGVDRFLSKELYLDRFKPLVKGARAIVDEYLE